MTMFANSSMGVTVDDAIKGMEELLEMAQRENRRAAIRSFSRSLAKLRSQTNEEFRAMMGYDKV